MGLGMNHPTDLEKEARETWDLAKRARLLAQEFSLEADRERLYRLADDLGQRVAELEIKAAVRAKGGEVTIIG